MLWEKEKKKITDEWLNSSSDDEINRIIIGLNDGQGDHSFYTYNDVVELLEDCDITKMTKSEILNHFLKDFGFDTFDTVYFNGKEYQMVDWC